MEFPDVYSHAYPTPKDFAKAQIAREGVYFDQKLGEFVLPCDVVRQPAGPESTLIASLESTYQVALDLAGWDRDGLERLTGEPLRPRPVTPQA